MKKICELLAALWLTLLGQLSTTAPADSICHRITPTGDLKVALDDLVADLHDRKFGKIRVSKHGICRDENGICVPAICLRAGEIRTSSAHFVKHIVYEQSCNSLHLLLVRSDCKTPLHRLFPLLGTAQDWRVLQKCESIFSAPRGFIRNSVQCITAQEAAANDAAAQYLQAVGMINSTDLNILEGMGPERLQILDCVNLFNLYPHIPDIIVPNFVHVLRTRTTDDLDELRRIFKAGALSPTASGRDVPIYTLSGKTAFQEWKRSLTSCLLTYDKAAFAQLLLNDAQRIEVNGTSMRNSYPTHPILVGTTIWSSRACVEIDIRGLRFSDEELRTIRKFAATVYARRDVLFEGMERGWREFCRSEDAGFTAYSTAWFRTFHYALAEVLFPGYETRFRFIDLYRSADAARVRLRDDRADRYTKALHLLTNLTGNEEWICPKPRTKADAMTLTSKRNGAFLHKLGGTTVLAFSAKSLIARTGIDHAEFDDFILKLKQNQLIMHKTEPVTFANREQQRFTCVAIPLLTVTAAHDVEGGEEQ